MPNLVTTTIDILRHGEPLGGSRYRGHIDDPLSAKGWAQMRTAVGDHCPWQKIYSSTLSRCCAFAQELAQRHQRPLQTDERLKEIGFGAWEGRTAQELEQSDPERVRKFWDDPLAHTPPGAESLTDFCERVIAVWNDLVACNAGQHILIVGHAGVLRMIVRHILEMPLNRLFRIDVPNACITRIRVDTLANIVLPRLVFHDGRLA